VQLRTKNFIRFLAALLIEFILDPGQLASIMLSIVN